MEQWNVSRDVMASLDAVDDIIRQQKKMLNNIQGTKAQNGADTAYKTPSTNQMFDKFETFESELATLFKDDEKIADLLNDSPIAASKPLDLSEQQEEPVRNLKNKQQPISQTNSFGQQPITEINAYRKIEQDNDYRQPEPIPQGTIKYPKIEPNVKPKREKMRIFKKKNKNEAVPGAATITEQQLRALSRQHLFMMIRDLEKELQQVKRENESMLIAYQAGYSRKI